MNNSDYIKFASKILLPRFDTFGDLVLMEGFVEQVRKLFPSAEITMLVRSGYEQMSLLYPTSLRLNWLSVEGNPYHSATEEEREIYDDRLNLLSAEHWDLIVFTAYNRNWMVDALAEKFTSVFKVIMGTGTAIEGWAIEQFMIVPVEEWSHDTAKYQVLISAMAGRHELLPMPKLELGAEFRSQATDLMAKLGIGDSHCVACFPAGTQNQTGKVWPQERYAELLSWLYSELGYIPLLLGHQGEGEIIRSLALMLASRGITAPIWLGRDGEIPILAGLLQCSSLYVGNDTGPMHIAAAVGTPVIGLFGGGTFPRFLPVGQRAIGIAGELPCFGCYWNCLLGNAPCMRVVTVEDAKRAVLMVLAEQPPISNYLPVMDECGKRLNEFMQKCLLVAGQDAEKYEACQDHLRAIQSSYSWRITTPLRWLSARIHRCLK